LDTYLEALDEFPRTDIKLKTAKGTASCQKIDIFKRLMWFAYDNDGMNWHQLQVDKVNEIADLNKKGKNVASLEEYIEDMVVPDSKFFNNVVGQDSLTRFDQPKKRRTKRRNNKRSRSKNRNTQRNG
jgi:hypothetical protein